MRKISFCHLALVLIALFTVISCGRKGTGAGNEESTDSIDSILFKMRTSAEWVRQLDSMAALNLGEGARCLDAVKHTFVYDGRTWVFNQDWGGVLEIPSDYLVDDDRWQALSSYHGADIVSPDSLVLISHYEGLCPTDSYEEFLQQAKSFYDDQPYVKIISMREGTFRFANGHTSGMVDIELMTDDGIKGYTRQIYSSRDGVGYEVSIQFPSDMETDLKAVIEMVGRYPMGPHGEDPVAGAI